MQREGLRNGRKENRKFVDEGGVGTRHWQRGPEGPDLTVEVYVLGVPKEKKSQCWKLWGPQEKQRHQVGQLHERKRPRALNSEKESSENFRWN